MIILKILRGVVGISLIVGAIGILAFLVFQVALMALLSGALRGSGPPPPNLTGTILVYTIPAAILLFVGLKLK